MGAPTSTSLGLAITFPALATIAVCARFWARHQKKMKLWWDDYLILPGLVNVALKPDGIDLTAHRSSPLGQLSA